MTAEACNLPVYGGPSECTAIGNLLVQAISCGLLKNIGEGRQLVRKSSMPVEYIPSNTAQWDEAAAKFENLINSPQALE
jgi:rhamnulokinase